MFLRAMAKHVSDAISNGRKTMKVGVFGGTFDPVHLAHIHCAIQALDALNLDEVIFVPAGIPSFKRDRELAASTHRLKMCELAVSCHPEFKVSDIEVKREGISYSIDTIEELLFGDYENAELFFIIGSDAFLTLPEWRRAADLAQLVDFAVLMRENDDDRNVIEVAGKMNAKVHLIDCERLDISSSQVRDALKRRESVSEYLPESVSEYIRKENLYHD